MSFVLGMNAKLYYKVGGVAAGGAWIELSNAREVTVNGETAEADVTTRNNNGWRATVATLRDASIEFEMIWDDDDTGFHEIKDAWLNNEVIGIAALDGDQSSGEGLVADMMVTNFSRNESLEEALKVSVTVKPTFSLTPPDWTTSGL